MTQKTNSQIQWRVGRRAVYVFFSGDIEPELPSPQALVQVACREQRPLLVLDFTKADGANTPVLQWIEQLSAMAEADGLRLRVVAQTGSRLRWLLEMLRFSRFVLVLESVREAVSLGRPRKRSVHL